MDLFSITCTTCKSRLKVREEAAIGHILACPKCGGMVMVKPPDGWQKGQPAAAAPAEAPAGITTVVNLRRPEETRGDSHFEDIDELLSDAPPRLKPSGVSVSPDAPGLARPRFVGAPPAATHPAPPATVAASNGSPGEATGTNERPSASAAPSAAAAAALLPASPPLTSTGSAPASAIQPPPPAQTTSPTAIAAASASAVGPLRYWLMMAGSVAAGIGLALAVVVGMIWLFRADPQTVVQAQTNGQTQAGSTSPTPVTPVVSVSPKTTPPAESEPAPTTPPITPAPVEPASKDPAEPTEPAAPIDPMPPAAEEDDPLGLTKPPPDAPAEPARSNDPLAKFDELIGSDREDPLVKPAEPAEAAPAAPPEADPADATPARPILPRPPPRSVDTAARLADPLAGIETPGTPLADFLQVISDLSTIPITLETDALPYYGLTPESPVVLKASNTTVGGALSSALAPLRLEHVKVDGHLLVRAIEPVELPLLGFPIKDLTDADETQMSELAEAMKTLVQPDAWNEAEAGGSIGVNTAKGTLDIRQRRAVHADLLVAFEKLRTGRKLPYATGSKYDPALFALSTRSAKAKARLETPVSLTFAQPTHFVRILDHLAKAGGVRILVDWRDIASAGWNADGEATLVADKQPLGAALDALLNPMDLAWRIVDGRTIQVLTPQRLADRLELEFYKVDTLTADDPAGAALITKVRSALGDSLFRDSGADDSGGQCELRYDEPSQCLLASLPQPKQRELETLLETLRADAGK